MRRVMMTMIALTACAATVITAQAENTGGAPDTEWRSVLQLFRAGNLLEAQRGAKDREECLTADKDNRFDRFDPDKSPSK